MYKKVDLDASFAQKEVEILKFWDENECFQKSLDQIAPQGEFRFFDGPAFATGIPHFGHLIGSILKDIVPRYKTMQGYHVERRFGWDCHGLPIEYEIEKSLNLPGGHKAVEEYGIEKFSDACRSVIMRYNAEWKKTLSRLGRWVDFDGGYKTMDFSYMQSVWSIFTALYEQKKIYKGASILPYCPRCATVLSNHEVGMGENFEETEIAATVKFPVLGEEKTYFLSWTTTPWTLPSNLALSLSPEIDYVKLRAGDENYYIASSRIENYFEPESFEVLAHFKGAELAGKKYEPLYPFFDDLTEQGAFQVITADFVTEGDGTGIVHTANGFGEEDFEALAPLRLPVVCPVDDEMRFTSQVPSYAGRSAKECSGDINKELAARGLLFRPEKVRHAINHCWRCKTPLLHKAVSSWFVDVPSFKNELTQETQKISWTPAHIKNGRFGRWINGVVPWAVSRNRFWGNPIPVWTCSSCGHEEVMGSAAQLEARSGQKITDLHKDVMDKITLSCPKCGKVMKRVPEILDCWFESGSMPYAQDGTDVRMQETSQFAPADFIAEGLDQTRGWFYTLNVLSTALHDRPAFLHAVVNGIVLNKEGRKMSKSERNYTDPVDILNAQGADALRLALASSVASRGENLKFDDSLVSLALSSFSIPLANAVSFFVTYANIDKVTMPFQQPVKPADMEKLDHWILSEVEALKGRISRHMENYEIAKACSELVLFTDTLNNWYIRLSRKRFWSSGMPESKRAAYQTLWHALLSFLKLIAPFTPFISERFYQILKTSEMPLSVHLERYPEESSKNRMPELEEEMALARSVIVLGRSLRSSLKIRTRQPLAKLFVSCPGKDELLTQVIPMLKKELNVKSVALEKDDSIFVSYTIKPNYKILGKKIGPQVKEVAKILLDLPEKEVFAFVLEGLCKISLEGQILELTKEDLVIQRDEKDDLKSITEQGITLAFDAHLTEELEHEGLVRDFIRFIQNRRKEEGFELSDRIKIKAEATQRLSAAIHEFKEMVCAETLCAELEMQASSASHGKPDDETYTGVEELVTRCLLSRA